jgi:hypothetical protein
VHESRKLSAPFFLPTFFTGIRYQIKEIDGNWCCFFCQATVSYVSNKEKNKNNYQNNHLSTKYICSIRAPPSEI